MDSALAWIGQIAAWIGQWFPRWMIVERNAEALKTEGFFLPAKWRRYKENSRIEVCRAGLHWWWPATTTFDVYPTAFQTDNLPSQTVETSDGISVTVGGMVSYRVHDLAKLIPNCYSPVKAIQTMTLPAIHQVVCRLTWAELSEMQRKRTLGTKLRKETEKGLQDFGIEVDSVELTDLVRTPAFRLIQSTQTDNG
jgi:regulator of protease activity HflC (stomatin/prohibitin superfamily)